MGFRCPSDVEVNVYTKHIDGQFVAILLFVDDMFFVGDDPLIDDTIATLSSFRINDLGKPTLFLGIQIQYRDNFIFIHRQRYVNRILTGFQMQDATPRRTPFPTNSILQEEHDLSKLLTPENASRYQAIDWISWLFGAVHQG